MGERVKKRGKTGKRTSKGARGEDGRGDGERETILSTGSPYGVHFAAHLAAMHAAFK